MSGPLIPVGVGSCGLASKVAARTGHRGRSGSALTLVVWTAAALAVPSFLLVRLGGWFAPPLDKEPLLVYCASGLRAPVEWAARKYEQEYGVPVRLQYGSSGGLESTIEVRPHGDLVIPAGIDPFIVRMRKKGLVAEAIPLAQFRLVLAVREELEEKITSLDELMEGSISYGLTNEQAAAGKTTREALEKSGDWVRVRDGARVVKPTVTDLAQDISLDVGVDAGFVWDATARQFGLKIVELPELRQSRSTIAAGVLTASRDPAAALRFARYLAAPEKGQVEFARQHYESSSGDPWAVRPELTLFSGGVNRIAIQDTLEEFQRREGCRITVVYHGCGTLVGMMKAGQMPDAYFACDVSFVEQVRDQFFDPHNVSRTDMVILVKAGNPQQIKGLEDLARPGLSVGLADEKLSGARQFDKADARRLGALAVRAGESAGNHSDGGSAGRTACRQRQARRRGRLQRELFAGRQPGRTCSDRSSLGRRGAAFCGPPREPLPSAHGAVFRKIVDRHQPLPLRGGGFSMVGGSRGVCRAAVFPVAIARRTEWAMRTEPAMRAERVDLTDEDRSIYEWQLLVRGYGSAEQRALKGSSVLVSRVGGVGGAVALELAAAGVGRLVLAHAGNVGLSDLNRQLLVTADSVGKSRIDCIARRLREFNARMEIEAVAENVSPENADRLVDGVDLVVDCAPLFEERYAMNLAAVSQRKPLVECAMYELEAYLTTIVPGRTPCLSCLWQEKPPYWTRKFPVFGAVSGAIGSLAAMEAVKVLTGYGEPLLGRLLTLDLYSMTSRTLKIARRPDCGVCGGSSNGEPDRSGNRPDG